MFFWTMGKELNRIPKGRKAQFLCGKCHQQATFYECQVDDSFKAFFVVELYKKTQRSMQCGECLAVCDYYQVFPEEKEELKEQQIKAESQKKQEEQDEPRRKEELDRQRREEERRRQQREVEGELEKIKRKLGK